MGGQAGPGLTESPDLTFYGCFPRSQLPSGWFGWFGAWFGGEGGVSHLPSKRTRGSTPNHQSKPPTRRKLNFGDHCFCILRLGPAGQLRCSGLLPIFTRPPESQESTTGITEGGPHRMGPFPLTVVALIQCCFLLSCCALFSAQHTELLQRAFSKQQRGVVVTQLGAILPHQAPQVLMNRITNV